VGEGGTVTVCHITPYINLPRYILGAGREGGREQAYSTRLPSLYCNYRSYVLVGLISKFICLKGKSKV